jgi:3D-(3,5/4)-trihydroxycyclohexane-1,2-dione acylhydrolase (decyclizing)
VPEVSTREAVRDARAGYETAIVGRKAGNTPA